LALLVARQELGLDEQLTTAGQLVVRARIFYDLWRFYEGAETRPAMIDTMREYNEYFRLDPHAHFVAFIVHIAALFDAKRNDVISLPRLVKLCNRSGKFPPKVIEEVKDLLSQIQECTSSVAVLRHNLFAHRSAFTSFKKAFTDAAVTPNQLAQLTETGLQIINRLLLASGQQEQHFTGQPLADAKAMMQALSSNSDKA
jgi:hypothetical protein